MQFAPWQCRHCGQSAKGIWENIPGLALLAFDDQGQATYAGDTEVDWNRQTPRYDPTGRVLLECPAGHRWPAVGRD